MSKLHRAIAKECIKAVPEEACGVVLGSEVIPLKNCSDEPCESFVISGADYLKYSPSIIYHSHPKGDYGMSDHDITVAANMDLTSYVYVVEQDRLEVFSNDAGLLKFEKVTRK